MQLVIHTQFKSQHLSCYGGTLQTMKLAASLKDVQAACLHPHDVQGRHCKFQHNAKLHTVTITVNYTIMILL